MLGFRMFGDGPERVMVLHDWTSDSRSYRRLISFLDPGRFSYVFPDLRGYGLSRHLAGDCTLAEVSEDCAVLADQLGWDRHHLVGHSMTGTAAQRIACDRGPRIQSLVAICPMSAAGSGAGPEAMTFFRQTTHDDDAFRRLIGFVAPDLPERCVERKLRHNRRNVSKVCRESYLKMFWSASFAEEVRGLRTPTLVIVGDRDPGLGAEAMRQTYLSWHQDVRLQEIPGCGHFPMLSQPKTLAASLEAFLGVGWS